MSAIRNRHTSTNTVFKKQVRCFSMGLELKHFSKMQPTLFKQLLCLEDTYHTGIHARI